MAFSAPTGASPAGAGAVARPPFLTSTLTKESGARGATALGDATLEALTEAVRAFVPVVRGLEGVVGLPLIAAGHSAGAHLAVELALTDWPARGVPANAISGVAAFSGIYNLEPLIVPPINDNLRLDVPAARAASPIRRVRGGTRRTARH